MDFLGDGNGVIFYGGVGGWIRKGRWRERDPSGEPFRMQIRRVGGVIEFSTE
jgi:hypothetical protein